MTHTAAILENVNVSLGNRPVLHGINIEFKSAKWTNIIGPNGAGKSTLLGALAGLIPMTGKVMYPALLQSQPNSKEKARHLAWLGQNQLGADDLSVYDIVMLGRIPHQGWLSSPSAEDQLAVERSLKRTHAWESRTRSLKELSGGERQRALLARALAVNADILLMDEPLTSLDPPHQVDWLEVVKSLLAEQKTVITVLHELTISLLADEIVLLKCGQIEHQGSSSNPVTHRAIEQVFENKVQILKLNDRWISVPKITAEN